MGIGVPAFVGATCCIGYVRWKSLEQAHNRVQQYLKLETVLEMKIQNAHLKVLLTISDSVDPCIPIQTDYNNCSAQYLTE